MATKMLWLYLGDYIYNLKTKAARIFIYGASNEHNQKWLVISMQMKKFI